MDNLAVTRHVHEMLDARTETLAAIRRTTESLQAANAANGVAIAALGEANAAVGAAAQTANHPAIGMTTSGAAGGQRRP